MTPCDIEKCEVESSQTLTVKTADDTHYLYFCRPHALAVQDYMAKRLGGTSATLDMYRDSIPYNVGDLQQAISHLEAI